MDRIPERRHDPSRYDCTGSEGSPREVEILLHVPQERLIYDRHLDAIMIQNDVIDTAKLEGRIEGKAEGLAEGMRQVASRMKDTGVDVATIVKCTGLSERNSFVFVRGVHFSISHYLYAEGIGSEN